MSKYWPYLISLIAGIAASLAYLPYPWAHIASGAVSSGLGVIVATSAAAVHVTTSNQERKP